MPPADAEVEDAPLDYPTACRRHLEAWCSAFHTCMASWFESEWGDEASCVAEFDEPCAKPDVLPGTADATETMRCLEGLTRRADYLCRVWFRELVGEDVGCDFAGSLPNGASCKSYAQCASSRCVDDDACCGSCVASPPPGVLPLGADCGGGTDDPPERRCAPKGGCIPTDAGYRCVPPVGEGEACDAGYCDHLDLQCTSGRCVTFARNGEPCATSQDCMPNEWCDPARRVCAGVPVAAAGEPCGYGVPGYEVPAYRYCQHGFTCGSSGTCEVYVPKKLGDACTSGDWCGADAHCTDGVCAPLVCP
jgi:hypothetical protein